MTRGVQTKTHFLSTLPAEGQYGNELQSAHVVKTVSTVSGIQQRTAVLCAIGSGHLKILRKNQNRTTINDDMRRGQEVITVL